MTDEKEEVEVVRGLLPFTVGGQTRMVPELKWRENQHWQDQLQATFVRLANVAADTPEGLRAMADAERELVLSYDATGALGDLEDATEREIDAIYNRLMEVAYPLAASLPAVLIGIVRAASQSAPENSTNGPSPTGPSAVPTISSEPSPIDRSSSSTPRRKSA